MSKMRGRNYVTQTRACSKSVLGSQNRPVTPILFISTRSSVSEELFFSSSSFFGSPSCSIFFASLILSLSFLCYSALFALSCSFPSQRLLLLFSSMLKLLQHTQETAPGHFKILKRGDERL